MRFSSPWSCGRTGFAFVAASALCGITLLAGCGGGGSNNGTSNSTARIRAVNAVANSGLGTISVGGAPVGSGQNYFSASTYQALGNGAAPITFSLSANPGTAYPASTQTFAVGSYYSLILVGRSDITSVSDPRYPTVLFTPDSFPAAQTSGVNIRVVQAAPDAGSVDVLLSGSVAAGGTAYKSVTSYLSTSTSLVPIQINQSGTNTVLVPSQTLSLLAGHVYTVYVLESTVLPSPVYSILATDDTATKAAVS